MPKANETLIGSDRYFDWSTTSGRRSQGQAAEDPPEEGLRCAFQGEIAEEIEQREARLATELRHPLVWGVRSWEEGYAGCSVDPLVGWSLEELTEQAPFSEAAAASVALDLCRAAQFLAQHPARPPRPFPDPHYVIVTEDGAAHLETPFFHRLRSRIVIT